MARAARRHRCRAHPCPPPWPPAGRHMYPHPLAGGVRAAAPGLRCIVVPGAGGSQRSENAAGAAAPLAAELGDQSHAGDYCRLASSPIRMRQISRAARGDPVLVKLVSLAQRCACTQERSYNSTRARDLARARPSSLEWGVRHNTTGGLKKNVFCITARACPGGTRSAPRGGQVLVLRPPPEASGQGGEARDHEEQHHVVEVIRQQIERARRARARVEDLKPTHSAFGQPRRTGAGLKKPPERVGRVT